MHTEIITIGDEILIGQITDTNSAWIARQLNAIGMEVAQITSISDRREHISQALREAEGRAEVILITGGLGPTPDDLTKDTLASYFDVPLKTDEEALEMIGDFFAKRGRELTDVNRKQAELPVNCTMLPNPNGTAPGMWFEERGRIFVSMPGVPHEMKPMMEDHVLPRLARKYDLASIYHKTVLTQGIGESFLFEKIAGWEKSLPGHIKLAYLPSAGMVRLRLSARGEREVCRTTVDAEIEKLKKIIPQYIFGYDNDTLQSLVGEMLHARNQTIATAESCTGGYLAHLITSVPGSSAYFLGGIVSYANTVKEHQLGVQATTLHEVGAVSKEVVLQMANGARNKLQADYALATSGIAGPKGGTAEKPVGTVWIAVAGPGFEEARCFHFGDDRDRNIHLAAITALNMLRGKLVEQE